MPTGALRHRNPGIITPGTVCMWSWRTRGHTRPTSKRHQYYDTGIAIATLRGAAEEVRL